MRTRARRHRTKDFSHATRAYGRVLAAAPNRRPMSAQHHARRDTEAPDPGAEPLLPDQQPQQGPPVAAPAARRHGGEKEIPWLTVLGFLFLTLNSGMAIYRAQGSPAAVVFVVFSYVDLVLLFVCLRCYEAAEPGSARRGRLKLAVWLLTTALTLAFSYKVAAIMPAAVALLVWTMAFATVAGGFYAFFLYEEKQ